MHGYNVPPLPHQPILQFKIYGHFLPIPRSHGLAKGLNLGFAFKLNLGFAFKLNLGFASKLNLGFTSKLNLGFISKERKPLLPLQTFDVQGQQSFEACAPLDQFKDSANDKAEKAANKPTLRFMFLIVTDTKNRAAKTGCLGQRKSQPY